MAEGIEVPDLRQTYVECDGCEDDAEVEWYCTTCKSNLCGKCKTARLHRNHVLKTWTDPDAVKARQDVPVPCKIHSGQNYGTFCKTCKCVCCHVCVAEIHSGHHFATIDSIAQTKVEEAKKTLNELKNNYLQNTRKSVEVVEKRIADSVIESQTRRDQIQNKASSLKRQIELSQKQLIEEEVTSTDQHLKDLKQELSSTKEKERLIESAIEQMEKEFSLWNKVQFIQNEPSFPTLGELSPPELSLPEKPDFQESKYRLPDANKCLGTVLYIKEERKDQGESEGAYGKDIEVERNNDMHEEKSSSNDYMYKETLWSSDDTYGVRVLSYDDVYKKRVMPFDSSEEED